MHFPQTIPVQLSREWSPLKAICDFDQSVRNLAKSPVNGTAWKVHHCWCEEKKKRFRTRKLALIWLQVQFKEPRAMSMTARREEEKISHNEKTCSGITQTYTNPKVQGQWQNFVYTIMMHQRQNFSENFWWTGVQQSKRPRPKS